MYHYTTYILTLNTKDEINNLLVNDMMLAKPFE